jgi:aldehyde dehydrogenase (NAD+)
MATQLQNKDQGFTIAEPERLYIGGEWRAPVNGTFIDVVSPVDGIVGARVAAAGPQDIEAAVRAARDAFDNGPWPRMPIAERAAIVRKIGALLRERLSETTWATTLEMGAPLPMAKAVAERAAALFDEYAAIGEAYPIEDLRPRTNGEYAVVVSEPVGVVAAVVPWNGPALLAALKVAPALVAGCTVVLKPAPETPLDAYILAESIEAAGVPAGVFNLVPADREASDHLIRHNDVDKISFTGSTGVGKHILRTTADRVARVSLELGGKSAAIILDDADPDLVVSRMATEVTMNTGQICAALMRVIVPRAQAKMYSEMLADAVSKIRVGNPFEQGTQVGPLAMKRQLERVEGYISKGREEGATLLCGGARASDLGDGYYIQPTVFANVEHGMTIAREEIFGPVASVISHDGPDDAVRIANDSDYGLHGGVFTKDVDTAYAVARKLRTGNVGHNIRTIDWHMPFGGFKQSGLSREGGVEGFRNFLEIKTVYVATPPSKLAKG